jgi:hypothetical protein
MAPVIWAFERTTEERGVAFSARDDLARGELGVVTGVVTLSDGEGQLGQGRRRELRECGRIVGRGVARAQLRRERLAGRIGEAKVGGGIRRFPCRSERPSPSVRTRR